MQTVKRSGRAEKPEKTAMFARVKGVVDARPALMETVSWGAILCSTALAAVGVAGIVGWESDLAKLGTIILIGGTLLTEVAASRLPVHAERRFREPGAASKFKGLAVVAGFGVFTAWNVIAGHFGMAAIDGAGVADKRAPLERAAAIADANRETAEEALRAFDEETARQQDGLAIALRGAFEAGYVTAGSRSARSANADTSRAERREALAGSVARNRAADRAAEAELARAPTGRADVELWAFAAVLELLKGALVWFVTAARGAAPGPAAPSRNSDLKALTPAARRALKKDCASILAKLRHMEAARA